MADNKPSLLSSAGAGIRGWFKGIIGGSLLGLAVGALVGIFNPPMFFIYATLGASFFASLGGSVGFVRDIAYDIKTNQMSAHEVSKVAQVSFAQGVAVGHQQALSQEPEVESSVHRDRILKQRELAAQQQHQIH